MKKLLPIILGFCCISIVNADSLCAPVAQESDIVQAVKWYRDSAEKKALYNQAFLLGSTYVNNWTLHNHPKPKTWGVILDIDETTLDNSWYFRECTDLTNNEDNFSHYVANRMKSNALPGVVAFTHMVHDLGGYVSMVSNRDGSFQDASGRVLTATVTNLKKENVYFDQVVLTNLKGAQNPSDKNPRFNAIINNQYNAKQMVWSNTLPAHKVVAYFGDNIQDFPKFKQATMNAVDANDKSFKLFGNGYFILPNPMYGSWTNNKYN